MCNVQTALRAVQPSHIHAVNNVVKYISKNINLKYIGIHNHIMQVPSYFLLKTVIQLRCRMYK
jgi:hypothetical protein